MGLRLKTGEKLPRGVRRIAKQQLGRIISELSGNGVGAKDKSIHKARKGLKRIRAALRLIQPALPGKVFRREGGRFRKIRRTLAQTRDAQVLLKTVEKLRQRNPGAEAGAVLDRLKQALQGRQQEFLNDLGAAKAKWRTDLRVARRHLKEWHLDRLDWSAVCRGLRRTYEQGQQALAEARQTRAPEHLHEWRKRVQDLWYQTRMLKPIRPKVLSRLAADLKRLSEALGDDHDLAMLRAAAGAAKLEPDEFNLLRDLIHARRTELQQAAFALGRKLYAGKPAAFASRIVKGGKDEQQD